MRNCTREQTVAIAFNSSCALDQYLWKFNNVRKEVTHDRVNVIFALESLSSLLPIGLFAEFLPTSKARDYDRSVDALCSLSRCDTAHGAYFPVTT